MCRHAYVSADEPERGEDEPARLGDELGVSPRGLPQWSLEPVHVLRLTCGRVARVVQCHEHRLDLTERDALRSASAGESYSGTTERTSNAGCP